MKLFVTVGAQLPFDRLVKAVDDYASGQDISVIAQIGQSEYAPENFEHVRFLGAAEYTKALAESELVISHTGMGIIIQCMELNKKLLVVPRLKKYGEHRSDHQLDTIERISESVSSNSLLQICNDLVELPRLIDHLNSIDPQTNKFSAGISDASKNIGHYLSDYMFG